jgi:hypothetical protein
MTAIDELDYPKALAEALARAEAEAKLAKARERLRWIIANNNPSSDVARSINMLLAELEEPQ